VAKGSERVRGRGAAGSAPRRRRAGITLVEVLLATAILLLTSLSLAYAFSSTSILSRGSERSVAAGASLENVRESLAEVPYAELLSWNGVQVDRGDHAVVVTTSVVQIGLILVEIRAVDERTGVELGRLATYRAAET
jgi:hypothetical protein